MEEPHARIAVQFGSTLLSDGGANSSLLLKNDQEKFDVGGGDQTFFYY
jgi:hypothetical protein